MGTFCITISQFHCTIAWQSKTTSLIKLLPQIVHVCVCAGMHACACMLSITSNIYPLNGKFTQIKRRYQQGSPCIIMSSSSLPSSYHHVTPTFRSHWHVTTSLTSAIKQLLMHNHISTSAIKQHQHWNMVTQKLLKLKLIDAFNWLIKQNLAWSMIIFTK